VIVRHHEDDVGPRRGEEQQYQAQEHGETLDLSRASPQASPGGLQSTLVPGTRMPRPSAPPPRALLIDADAAFLADLHAESGMGLVRLEQATGGAHALRLLRSNSYDVVLTSPRSAMAEDLALLEELQFVRPSVKVIVLAPVATPEEVIASLRVQAFACFTEPFRLGEIAEMVRRAIQNPDWKNGLQVLSRPTA
jgi:ActR/RegA family two-component response regulator